MCALLIIGVVFILGCGSKDADLPVEAAPAPAIGAATAPEVNNANQPTSSQPTNSPTTPANDSSIPVVPPSSSNESTSESGSGSSNTTEALVVPVVDVEADSSQSDLFVERDGLDALSEALFLEIISPAEEVVFVESPIFVLKARTVIDAAVSVNDDLVDVNEEGILEIELTLEEGPNVVEVVTSLSNGDEKSAVLTIFYLP